MRYGYRMNKKGTKGREIILKSNAREVEVVREPSM
jgi:hypothetical protein